MPALKQTISVSRGKTAIEHDLREHTPNNVDALMTKYNVVLINELGGKTLAEYTNEYMKPYIDEYNKKQRRSDRTKSYDYAADYIKEQNNMQLSRQNYKAGQLAYEYVIQFGDHESMDVKEIVADDRLRKLVVGMFQDFIDDYQEAYPHMRIILATIHMDEPKGTPHMHILVQPVEEGYKQGLSHQISLTKALACDGFERSDAKKERLSLTRWQDDIKNRIMEPILTSNSYIREYKDGEKHHMPVALYKKTMEEKDAILADATEEADSITDKAKKDAKKIVKNANNEVKDLQHQKDLLINGTNRENGMDSSYEDWPMGALEKQRTLLLEGVPGKTDVKYMSVPKLKSEYIKWAGKFNQVVTGYDNPDGTHVPGYNELVEKYNEMLVAPKKLLETDVGKKVIADAKDEIARSVYHKLMNNVMEFVEKHIFEAIKVHLLEPLHRGIDKMLRGHWLKMDADDEKILQRAIDESVDRVMEELDVGKRLRLLLNIICQINRKLIVR